MVRAIVGANWGDEGKGKITDMLAKEVRHHCPFSGRKQRRPYDYQQLWQVSHFIILPSGVFYRSHNQHHWQWCGIKHSIPVQRD